MANTRKQVVAIGLAVVFGLLPIVTAAQAPGAGTRQNVRTVREAMTKEKIKLFGEKATVRLTAALNRAEGLRQRVVLHVSQFPNPKFDKTIVVQKLAEASEAIAKGRTAVAAIQTTMDSALAEDGTAKNGSFAEVRAAIRQAMTAIRAAPQKIVEAIRLIKAGYPPTSPTPTTTPIIN